METDRPQVMRELSVYDAIQRAIEEATRAIAGLGVIIAREDGLTVAHSLPDAQLAKRVAAMSASIVGTAQIATSELGQGEFEGASIEANDGRIVCLQAREGVIVTGLTPKETNLGLVLLALESLAKQVGEIIQSWHS
jgi:predicted regulator of Ras-like GTPase activity (Roadblock/LC7/MglB family)